MREPLLDPDEAVARESLSASPATARAATSSARSREADVVVDGEYRTQVVVHNSLETHQSAANGSGDTLEVHISTQYIWGVRARSRTSSGCRPTRCA